VDVLQSPKYENWLKKSQRNDSDVSGVSDHT